MESEVGFRETCREAGSKYGTYSELQSLIGVVEEYLAEVPPMGKIELEEHLAPQRNVPPEIVPPGQTGIDSITELLRIVNGRTENMSVLSFWRNPQPPTRHLSLRRTQIRTLFNVTIVFTSFTAVS